MVELQLEKLSPLPVAQIVWTMHVLGTHPARPGRTAGGKFADRRRRHRRAQRRWRNFSASWRARGYLADRLEVPMLDQLEATPADGGRRVDLSGVAGRPERRAGGVVVRRRAAEFELCRAAARRRPREEFEGPARATGLGGRTGRLADGAAEMASGRRPGQRRRNGKTLLRDGLDEPVRVVAPLPPAELAARTARRAAAAADQRGVAAGGIFHALPPAVC